MPNKPAKPATALEKIAGVLASALFIAFVVWLVNGAVQGGWVRWFAIALFVAPIVGLLGFYAAIFIAFVLEGKRNVRAAQQWQKDHPGGIAPEPEPKLVPFKRRRRRSRGNR